MLPRRSNAAGAANGQPVGPRRTPWLMILPALVVILVINIVPLLYGTVLAFYRWNLTQAQVPPRFVGIDNFVRLLTSPAFLDAAWHTALFVVVAVTLETILGLAIAHLLDQRLRGTGLVTALMIVPLALAPSVVGVLFGNLLSESLGPVNYWLGQLGMPQPPWLSDAHWSLWTVVLVDTWQWTSFMALLCLAGLRALPSEPTEAASVDGANAWQQFRFVTLPMLKPVLMVAILIRAIDAYKTFDLVYLLTFGGPGTSSQVLSFYGYKVGIEFFDIGTASAIALIMVQVFIVLAIVFYSRMREQL